jgi:integrase
MNSTSLPKWRNVKSGSSVVTDAHERRKDFLNETEIANLLEAAKRGRHGTRDHLVMLMTYRHGLRVSEVIGVRRDDIDLDQARFGFVASRKGWLSNCRSPVMNSVRSSAIWPSV